MIPLKGQLSIKHYESTEFWQLELCEKTGWESALLNPKKVINKKPRGYYAEYVTSDDVVVVIWKDNNDVSVASNFVGIGNEEDVRRWDKTKREHILVKQPEVIAKYNRSMGGVDKMDFLLSLYRTKIRSKKWTLRAIFHFESPAFDGLARMHVTMERIIGQKLGTKRFFLDASMKVAKEDQRVFCKKCEVPLCMTKDRNCYYKFHT
ncbi:hypothetical protein MRX96_053997 [Rhipicephalus microplus]